MVVPGHLHLAHLHPALPCPGINLIPSTTSTVTPTWLQDTSQDPPYIVTTSEVENTTQGDPLHPVQCPGERLGHHPGRGGAGQELCRGERVNDRVVTKSQAPSNKEHLGTS